MSETHAVEIVDTLTLRFVGETEKGAPLHELRAAHVAEVLQGIVELTGDFLKAGALGDGLQSEVLVRPAQEGSFMLEVLRVAQDPAVALAAGAVAPPSLGSILLWATKSARADVEDYDYLENGNVKVCWQDKTVQEIPRHAWDELQKQKRRRKKQLRKIMAPLSDPRVSAVEVSEEPAEVVDGEIVPPVPAFELARPDYNAVSPEDEIEETFKIFDADAQMSAIDFDDPEKWRVRTKEAKRSATVEDQQFLDRVAAGLAIRKTDIFNLEIREDILTKNGRTTRKWTVLRVKSHRRAAHDDDA
ncbi:hypothetical protein ACLM5J_09660 [Nocardioides sp. Bht2]|uniref:hypothetical protein n=1 Tax=Nocardioides sp. Bht2 TaxID=3392297 RepID=UPI0039B69B48